MKKKYFIFIFLFFGCLLFANLCFAKEDEFRVYPEKVPLFSLFDFLPGKEASSMVSFENKSNDFQTVLVKIKNLKETPESGFSKVLYFSIKEKGKEVLKKIPLSLFKNQSFVFSLSPKKKKDLTFLIYFDKNASSFYQKKGVSFDFIFEAKWGRGKVSRIILPGVSRAVSRGRISPEAARRVTLAPGGPLVTPPPPSSTVSTPSPPLSPSPISPSLPKISLPSPSPSFWQNLMAQVLNLPFSVWFLIFLALFSLFIIFLLKRRKKG